MVYTLPEHLGPDERLDALEAHLQRCARLLDSAQPEDMHGVDQEVARLCGQVLALPAEESARYVPRLETLARAFGVLGEATRHARDETREEINNLQARQMAHRAYGMQTGKKDERE